MKRFPSPPVNWADRPEVQGRQPGAVARHLATNREEASNNLKTYASGVSVSHWVPNHTQPHGLPHQLEYHTLHEEIFVLAGSIIFDKYYTMTAPAYMNHPPFWVHPTNFRAGPDGLVMLMRQTTDPIVQFEDIPENWDAVEFYATGKPTQCKGVTKLQLDEVPWQPMTTTDGVDLGYDGKFVWYDDDDGWTTWLMRMPAGWQGQGAGQRMPGSDEIYLLEGDLTLDRGDGPMEMTAGGYFCDPDTFVDGGSAECSSGGCTAIRWTRGTAHLALPSLS